MMGVFLMNKKNKQQIAQKAMDRILNKPEYRPQEAEEYQDLKRAIREHTQKMAEQRMALDSYRYQRMQQEQNRAWAQAVAQAMAQNINQQMAQGNQVLLGAGLPNTTPYAGATKAAREKKPIFPRDIAQDVKVMIQPSPSRDSYQIGITFEVSGDAMTMTEDKKRLIQEALQDACNKALPLLGSYLAIARFKKSLQPQGKS
jgi:hypothetical protein